MNQINSGTKTRPIRVLLVDDHALVRAGLKRVLEEDESISVVAEASNGGEAMKEFQRVRPDVVILDIFMPVMDGLDTTKQLLSLHPEARILVLTMCLEQQYASRILRAGALGYITKGTSTRELHCAVNTVAKGARYLSDEGKDVVIMQLLNSKADLTIVELLSDRELQVLCLLAHGKKMKEIAESLCLSPRTIETYRSRIMIKLGLSNRAEIIEFALTHKLI